MDWFGFRGRGSGMGEVPPACSYSYYLAYDIYKVAEVSDMALLLSVARAPHLGLSAVCLSTLPLKWAQVPFPRYASYALGVVAPWSIHLQFVLHLGSSLHL